jgi:hypothetical protein
MCDSSQMVHVVADDRVMDVSTLAVAINGIVGFAVLNKRVVSPKAIFQFFRSTNGQITLSQSEK